MSVSLIEQQHIYAHLLICLGVNLQPGQALRIRAELVHREFVRMLATQAYEAGARLVDVEWIDPLLVATRLQHSRQEYLSYLPEFEAARAREILDTDWAIISVSGSEYPSAFDAVDPELMRTAMAAQFQKLAFWRAGLMRNELAWCVCAAPTPAWAQKVFPDLPAEEAVQALWREILAAVRADQPDPIAAWSEHDSKLKQLTAYLEKRQVRSLHFFDPAPGEDGKPRTDLIVGLTDRPRWLAGSGTTAKQLTFFPNMPTEEAFSTPHRQRAQGWVRSSRPGFPFQREVRDAYFRFEDGEVVEFRAEHGEEILAQYFEIPGTRRLGEVALVDTESPIFQSGLIFHNILFDENAACHIAFGKAYPGGVQNGDSLGEEELLSVGVNQSDMHQDFMIGTTTMNITGIDADGEPVPIMEQGRFPAEVFQSVSA